MRRIVIALAMAAAATVWAASGHEGHTHEPSVKESEAAIKGVGVIKRIEDSHESVNIFHEPILQLKWSAMNMPFGLSDHTLIHGFKVGDKVNFEFVQKDGKNIIVKISK